MDTSLNQKKGLQDKVITGSAWVFSFRVIHLTFSIIKLIILARILAPNDFGLFGIAMVTLATLEQFTQTGFKEALVQKNKDINIFLDAAWTVIIVRGVILFIALFIIAPYVAGFFHAQEAGSVIRVIGFSYLIESCANIGVIYFQKELEFKKQFTYQITGTIGDFFVSIIAALLLRNVWAIVLGLLAGNVIRLMMSYIIHPYKPNLSFNLEKIRELFGFGKWVFGSSFFLFLLTQGDDLFVGKLLGASMLGLYQMAYKFSNIPATQVTHVISQVTFPAYSKMQENQAKLRDSYLKVMQVTVFVTFPIAGLIFILSTDFTNLFIGQKWVPMIPAMKVLCFYGITRSFGATAGPLFHGIGKPEILTRISGFQLIILIVLIYPFTQKLGILGTSISVVLSNFFTMIVVSIVTLRIIKCGARRFVLSLLFPLVATIAMGVTTFTAVKFFSIVTIPRFIMTAGLGGITYLFVSYLIYRVTQYENMSVLVQLIGGVKQ